MSNKLAAPVDDTDYLVKGGELDGLVFRASFGRRRRFRAMAHVRTTDQLSLISSDSALVLPLGPPMPNNLEHAELEVLLKESDVIDDIREAFCRDFQGTGYEIGAGSRPTIIHTHCRVT